MRYYANELSFWRLPRVNRFHYMMLFTSQLSHHILMVSFKANKFERMIFCPNKLNKCVLDFQADKHMCIMIALISLGEQKYLRIDDQAKWCLHPRGIMFDVLLKTLESFINTYEKVNYFQYGSNVSMLSLRYIVSQTSISRHKRSLSDVLLCRDVNWRLLDYLKSWNVLALNSGFRKNSRALGDRHRKIQKLFER